VGSGLQAAPIRAAPAGPWKTGMKVTQCVLAVGALWEELILSGCTGSSGRPAAGQPLDLPHADGQRTFDAAVEVLGAMHFSIDKADPNTGLIRTHPLPGAQLFEVWRSDNVTLSDHMEANLHSLRRTAWITVVPQEQGVSVDCLVKVQRLNVPSQAVTGSTTIYRTLSESTPYAQSLRLSAEQQKGMEWVERGTDAALARRILRRIEARLKQTQKKTVK